MKPEIYTQTEITTLDNCEMLHRLKYVERLSPKIKYSPALYFGDLIHNALAGFYGGEHIMPYMPDTSDMTLDQVEEIEYYFELSKILMDAYKSYYKNDNIAHKPLLVEHTVYALYKGPGFQHKLAGKIDLIAKAAKNGKVYIWDHKTCSTFDRYILEGFEFRFQFMFYVWLAVKQGWKIEGYAYNAIRKPALRRQKGENLQGFLARCKQSITEKPEEYFTRQFIDVSPEAFERFEREILAPKMMKLQLIRFPKWGEAISHNMNTDYCFKYNQMCEFLPICKDGFQAHRLEFRVREKKHEEL